VERETEVEWGRYELTLENKAVFPLANGPTSSIDLTPLLAFLIEMGLADLGENKAIKRKTRRTTSERNTRIQLKVAGAIRDSTSGVGRTCDMFSPVRDGGKRQGKSELVS
jgi:hypothetical protein